MVKRGTAYIEGIARVFEARNYLAIWVALAVSATAESLVALGRWRVGVSTLVGALLAMALVKLMQGDLICDIATVELSDIRFDGALAIIGDTVMMNVGLPESRKVYEERGIAAIIRPNGPNAKATLANLGQMQAIAHDVSSMIGVYMDVGEQEFIPMVRRNPSVGSLHVLMVPSERDEEAFLAAIRRARLGGGRSQAIDFCCRQDGRLKGSSVDKRILAVVAIDSVKVGGGGTHFLRTRQRVR